LGSNEFSYTWIIKNDRADQNAKVAAPMSGVGPNGPSFTPTASAPDSLVGEPVVDATTANKPQRDAITPPCGDKDCLFIKCYNKCKGDFCPQYPAA